jgi:hypothetical protein
VSGGTDTLGVEMESVDVSVPSEARFVGVLRLVVGGLGSRCSLAVERIDELQLALEALLASRDTAGERVELTAEVGLEELVVRVGPFVRETDPAGMRVVSALVSRVGSLERDGVEFVELAVSVPLRVEEPA